MATLKLQLDRFNLVSLGMFSCSTCLLLSLFHLSSNVNCVEAAAADLSMCPTDLQNLIPCLNYVQGHTSVPSKKCCDNVLPIHLHTPQCLCALILAAINGTSGIPDMNITLSMGLGHACNIGTQPKRCPALLDLSPNSPEAKIFEAYNSTTSASSSTSNSTASMASTASTNSNSTSSSPDKSSASSFSFSSGAVILGLLYAIFIA